MQSGAADVPPPQQLADGVFWLRGGDCYTYRGELFGLEPDLRLHAYQSMYLIQGDEESLVIDTGHPKDWNGIARELDTLATDGVPDLRYIFPTHAEVPHSGNLGRLLDKYPDAIVTGDVRDYHLLFPGCETRLVQKKVGDRIDLGRTTVIFVQALIRDLPTSMWAYDTRSQTLFVADGFSFTHYHEMDQCGDTAEEMSDLPISDFTALVTGLGLYWTQFTDIEPLVAQLDLMVSSDEYPVRMIAPAHSSPILDPAETVPKVRAGLRRARGVARAGIKPEMR